MQAEADFTEAQTALAAVPIAGMRDLRIMIAAAELYDGIELCRINRAPIARAWWPISPGQRKGAVVRTNNKAPGLWIVAGTDGMACNSAAETRAEGKVSAKGHERLQAATGTAFDEPLSAKNGCLRKKRYEAWREAEAATRYWRARLGFYNALSFAQNMGISEGHSRPAVITEDRWSLVEGWRAAFVKQLLTPAPLAASDRMEAKCAGLGQI